MKIRMSRMRTFIVVALAGSIFFASGCKATPEHLERWENREGSEEMFEKHLHNPNADDAVRVRALELLAKQYRYSSTMFRDGLLSKMPDEDGRERVVKTALPTIVQGLKSEDETTRIYTRDALFHMQRQVESQENLDAISEQLSAWLRNDWASDPCREIGGVRAAQLFNEIGQEKTEAVLVEIFDEGDWEKTFCTLQNTGDVEWRSESTPVATAMLGFWDRGLVPEGLQNRVSFLDQLATFSSLPVVRDWAFTKVRDETLPTNDRGIMVALLSRSWSPEDLPKYQEMLGNTDLYRWEAVRALITLQDAEGLKIALENLPAESDYAFWDGARRTNGFNQATQFVCNLPHMKEKADEMRPVLVEQAQNGHLYAQAIASYCLGTHGDDEAIATLQTFRASLGRANDPVIPFWSNEGTTQLSQIIDEAVVKHQEAKAAAEQAAAEKAAAEQAAAEETADDAAEEQAE